MTEGRRHIDPEGRYPSVGLRRAEENAERVLTFVPGAEVERTRDCLQIDYGGEEGIVVLVMAEAIEVRLPMVEWTMGAYGPALSSRLWRRVKVDALTDEKLKCLLSEGLEVRRAEFKECRYCGRMVPPEHRHSDDVCHSCASEHMGVVY